jgi:hypothetical protein
MLSRYGRPLGIIAAIAAVGWVMGYGYWRMHITNALSAVEAQASPTLAEPKGFRVPAETLAEFRSAGDRSLPYIVEILKPDLSAAYQAALVSYYVERTERISPRATPDELKLLPSDPLEEREKAIQVVKMEWKHKWERRFRWWMWWSGECLE